VIGLVEEGAKLAGMLLAMDRRAGRPAAIATAVGVAAGFAAVEAIVTLRGEPSAPAFARAVLGPVAHALLSLPLAAGISTAATGQARRRLALAAALAAAAALHAAGDLGIALPGAGQLAYPAALAVPALALFRFARRARGPRKEEGPHEADPVTHEEVPRSS
jgi:RsiW-degrading membrane proteinase PrsW (M82 family)